MRMYIRNNLVEPFFWWSIMMILTFQVRYYKFYLPKEDTLYGDLTYILGCGGFKVQDVECSKHFYGRFLTYFLNHLTFLHPYTHIVVLVVVSISLVPLAYIFAQLNKMHLKILGLTLFLSPAIALLIQRANLDLLIFLLCWVAIKLFLQGRITFSLLIVFLASSFKIYPFALLILLLGIALANEVSTKVKIIWTLLAGSALCLALIDTITIPLVPSDARNSFGLRIFGEYFTYISSGRGYQMLPILAILLGITIFIFMITLINSSKFDDYFPKYQLRPEPTIWFLYFLLIFSSGISIDYRLLFLLPTLALLAELNRVMRCAVASLFFLSFYLSYPFEVLQVFGDISLFLLLSLNIVLLYKNRRITLKKGHLWKITSS